MFKATLQYAVNLRSKTLPEILFYLIMSLGAVAILALSISTTSWNVPLFLSVLALLVALIATGSVMLPEFTGAPWVPTSRKLVGKILAMSELKPGELLYDLGSGDGRIVITAARDFGAKAIGIEIDPFRVFYSRLRILQLGLRSKVRIVRGNFFNIALRDADVIVVYLLQETNDKLQLKLERELKPSCRVVSVVFEFKGWELIKADDEEMIYVYRPRSQAKNA